MAWLAPEKQEGSDAAYSAGDGLLGDERHVLKQISGTTGRTGVAWLGTEKQDRSRYCKLCRGWPASS